MPDPAMPSLLCQPALPSLSGLRNHDLGRRPKQTLRLITRLFPFHLANRYIYIFFSLNRSMHLSGSVLFKLSLPVERNFISLATCMVSSGLWEQGLPLPRRAQHHTGCRAPPPVSHASLGWEPRMRTSSRFPCDPRSLSGN